MPTVRDVAETFLDTNRLTVSAVDVDATLSHFLDEMDRGLSEGNGSLEMIPTFIACENELPCGETAIVIDAGGTNLRVCTVTIDEDGTPVIDNFVTFNMPGIEKPVSQDAFFNALAEQIVPLAHLSDKIGFCFSYPSEILPNRDGRLIRWTKGVQIPELVGGLVGKGLVEALDAMGCPGKRAVILNDTVACLLAGRVAGETRRCSDYVGFILGTGTNTAFVAENSAITKRKDLAPQGCMIVNLESGNFAIERASTIDVGFDAKTTNPGRQTFEKMISGAYLGPLCFDVLRALVSDGLFSDDGAASVQRLTELTTIDMDDFLGNPYEAGNPLAELCLPDTDIELLIHVFTEIVRRAALLTAINIAGTVIRGGKGMSPISPVCVNVDGSTFYKTNNFPRWALGYLDDILVPRGIHYVTVHVENAPVLGAAIAALTNA